MDNLKSKTALVYDYGTFMHVAVKLAEAFKKVYYYCPWKEAYPRYNAYIIGSGIDNIERVDSFWDCKNEKDPDLYVFTDVYDGDIQNELKLQGKRVFGSGYCEDMELFRDGFKEYLEEVDLPVGAYDVIRGLDNLRDYLEDKSNLFIKTNLFRGGFESMNFRSMQLDKTYLDKLAHEYGIFQNMEKFTVEAPLPDCAEIGYDGFVCDGRYPEKVIAGIEIKDQCYAGIFLDYDKLPDQVLETNAKLSRLFKELGYRGAFSSEIRVGADKRPYLIDPTCRFPSPPSELYASMYDNFPQMVWEVAGGNLIIPECKNRYGFQIQLHSQWSAKEWMPVYCPEEIRPYLKLKNRVDAGGIMHYIPSVKNEEGVVVGSVIAMADSLEEAIAICKFRAGKIEAYDIEFDESAIDKVNETIDKMKSLGINFF